MTFYIKDRKGTYIPITFENICFNSWSNKLIIIRVDQKNKDFKVDEIYKEILDSNAFNNLNNTSILVIPSEIEITALGNEILDEELIIKFSSDYTWFEIDSIQKKIKQHLKNKVRDMLFISCPIKQSEYSELMKIRRRIGKSK